MALIENGGHGLDDLERRLLEDDDPWADWDEVVRLAGQAESERIAGMAARALAVLGRTDSPTVGELLAVFAQGRGADLVLPLVRGGLTREELAEAVPGVTADVLAAAVHLSLAADGRARYALSWTGPRRWQLWYGEHGWQNADLEALVADAARDPAEVARLQQTLQSWGARLDLPIEPQTIGLAGAPPSAFWGHLLFASPPAPGTRRLRGKKRIVDMVIYPAGVLLVRPFRVIAFSPEGYARKAASRCDPLIETAADDPAGWAAAQGPGRDGGPAARWTPETELVGVQYTERPVRGDLLRITLRSGEVLEFVTNPSTVGVGEPLEELTRICNYT